MEGFGSAKTRSRSPRMSDLVDMVEWPKGDYESFRIVGPVFSVLSYWYDIKTQKGTVSIPKQCLDHSGETDDFVTDICPFRADGQGRESKAYFVNVIVRSEQESRRYPKPTGKIVTHLGYKCHLAHKGDTKKTPVRAIQIPSSVAEKIQQLQKLNKVKTKEGVKTYEAGHPKYGFDLNLLYDDSKEGTRKYDVQKGDRTELTAEERAYPIYRLDLLKPLSLAAAKKELSDLLSKLVKKKAKNVSSDDDDDEDFKPKKRRSFEDDDDDFKTKNKKRRPADDDIDEEDSSDFSEDDFEDEEDETPKPKKKSKRSRDDDEDFDDEDFDDGEGFDDEEDEPKSKKKSKRSRDDDEDFDEEDEDDEDFDEDEEDDEDFDEDEEEEEPPRRKAKSTVKNKRPLKRRR